MADDKTQPDVNVPPDSTEPAEIEMQQAQADAQVGLLAAPRSLDSRSFVSNRTTERRVGHFARIERVISEPAASTALVATLRPLHRS